MKKEILLLCGALTLLASSAQASLITQPMEFLRDNLTTTGSQSLTNEWQLGAIEVSTGTFTLLDTLTSRTHSSDTQYRWGDGSTNYYGAYFYEDATTAGGSNWMVPNAGDPLSANALGLHPLNTIAYDLVIRFLASEDGDLNVSGDFTSRNNGQKSVFIKDNSFTALDSSTITSNGSWGFNQTVTISANESVYIGMNSMGQWNSDATELLFNQVSFAAAQANSNTPIPEPSIFVLFTLSLGFLGFRSVRKS